MKKKNIITLIAILIIVIIAIIMLMTKYNYNTDSSKVIYSKSIYSMGFVPSVEIIEIYDNGVIKKNYTFGDDKEITTKRLSKRDLKSIKEAIEKVENCQQDKEDIDDYLEKQGLVSMARVEEYINLNRKIIFDNNNYHYNNQEIEQLNKLVSNIKKEYLEEE